ncbi:Fe/S biogenesis protein NfuA [Buchnera aphidicola (Anoecia corni)]|uniref:Fe/S biogenesis protein NfuA n=2 Tax=Buchnera aphidicola TaxID=9 RepID=A0AAT9IHS2_9GAMM
MHISKEAQSYFVSLLSKKKKNTHIRIFIISPGTQNAECGISYCELDEVSKKDIVLNFMNFNVYVRKSIFSYLKNAEIDLIKDNCNSQITFRAPFAKGRKKLTELTLFEQVKLMLDKEINPNLSLHNGLVTLVKITEKNIAVLKFSGGCNGCSMISTTLKDNIEKLLLQKNPELNGVIDITNHKYGSHSYI